MVLCGSVRVWDWVVGASSKVKKVIADRSPEEVYESTKEYFAKFLVAA
jgi:hypothetical protein